MKGDGVGGRIALHLMVAGRLFLTFLRSLFQNIWSGYLVVCSMFSLLGPASAVMEPGLTQLYATMAALFVGEITVLTSFWLCENVFKDYPNNDRPEQ